MTGYDQGEEERVIAEFAAAMVLGEEQPLSMALAARITAVGEVAVRDNRPTTIDIASRQRPTWPMWAGWAVAAAVALWAVAGRSPASSVAGPEATRGALLATQGALTWDRATDPTGARAEGDVVWSDSAQAGVMRFRGLAVNDPGQEQYQLWIFDAARDERYPVDGGVFNVASDSGDVLVRITPRIPVSNATLFVVTVERPGGVVVSDRSRIAVLAKRPSAS